MPRVSQRTIQTYDQIAPQFNRVYYAQFWENELKIFQKLVRGKKIIDIGCGAGREAEFFIKHTFEYVGIDASRSMLQEAQKRVEKGGFILMDFYHLKFNKEVFDGFWAGASLVHVPKFRIRKLLKDIKYILRPNGIGFISILEKTDSDQKFIQEERYNGLGRFFAFYTHTEFRQYLKESGFSVLDSYAFHKKNSKGTRWLCYFVQREI